MSGWWLRGGGGDAAAVAAAGSGTFKWAERGGAVSFWYPQCKLCRRARRFWRSCPWWFDSGGDRQFLDKLVFGCGVPHIDTVVDAPVVMQSSSAKSFHGRL